MRSITLFLLLLNCADLGDLGTAGACFTWETLFQHCKKTSYTGIVG